MDQIRHLTYGANSAALLPGLLPQNVAAVPAQRSNVPRQTSGSREPATRTDRRRRAADRAAHLGSRGGRVARGVFGQHRPGRQSALRRGVLCRPVRGAGVADPRSRPSPGVGLVVAASPCRIPRGSPGRRHRSVSVQRRLRRLRGIPRGRRTYVDRAAGHLGFQHPGIPHRPRGLQLRRAAGPGRGVATWTESSAVDGVERRGVAAQRSLSLRCSMRRRPS